MKRPWQIWSLFALCLLLVAGAMGWMTHKAIVLDHESAQAAGRELLEEDITLALWRADSRLMPLLAREVARPYFTYQSFFVVPLPKGKVPVAAESPSPVLVQPPEFVLLHFELRGDGAITSPQNPTGRYYRMALDNGAQAKAIEAHAAQLATLGSFLEYQQLLAQLPGETSPRVNLEEYLVAANSAAVAKGQAVETNERGLGQLRQQLEEIQQNAPRQAPRQSAAWQQRDNKAYGSRRDQEAQKFRRGVEFLNRDLAYRSNVAQQVVQQRHNYGIFSTTGEGISKPLWIGEHLILARRVQIDGGRRIQGCWLDWPKLKASLLAEIGTRLPGVSLEPVTSSTPESLITPDRMLATLPVRLVVPDVQFPPATFSPIRVSLLTVWACLLVAALSAAVLLRGVLALSERRGAFVSAVTHELRTPLTTFRMYSEMLAEDMLPDAVQRQTYLDTLRVEADRLAHLVENVLSYAQLERGRRGGRRETTTLGELVSRIDSRLSDRARQADMRLVVEGDDADRAAIVHTDPAAVEQILFNLVDNAAKYAASAEDRRIHVRLQTAGGRPALCVRDHGPGISSAAARALFQPFTKSAREAANTASGVGLGLALCRRLARDLGGELSLASPESEGATFMLSLPPG